MTKYVIAWDWDNTLMNTAKAIELALNDTMQHYGLPPVTPTELLDVMGHHKGAFWLTRFPGQVDEAFEYTMNRFAIYHKNAFLFERAYEILSFVQSKGVEQLVISNKPQELLEEEVKQVKAEKFFTHIIGTQLLGNEKKPYPSFGAPILKQLDYDQLIVIGDGAADMEYAQNIGALGVYVQKCQHKVSGLTYDYYFEDLDQVYTWLKKILKDTYE